MRRCSRDLKGTTAALAALAEQHADTLCVGRSLTQHSLPFTFGLRAAQWFHGVAAAGRRLEALELPVQFGGAAGTLAAGTVLTAGATQASYDPVRPCGPRWPPSWAWPPPRHRGTPTGWP